MDNPLIVNGQGTATLELLNQVQELGYELDAVVLLSQVRLLCLFKGFAKTWLHKMRLEHQDHSYRRQHNSHKNNRRVRRVAGYFQAKV